MGEATVTRNTPAPASQEHVTEPDLDWKVPGGIPESKLAGSLMQVENVIPKVSTKSLCSFLHNLLDFLQYVKDGGGLHDWNIDLIGNQRSPDDLSAVDPIRTTLNLTPYSDENEDFTATPCIELVVKTQSRPGRRAVRLEGTFTIGEVVEAHRTMEENLCQGEMVVSA